MDKKTTRNSSFQLEADQTLLGPSAEISVSV